MLTRLALEPSSGSWLRACGSTSLESASDPEETVGVTKADVQRRGSAAQHQRRPLKRLIALAHWNGLDLRWPPALVEERVEQAVESQGHEPG